MEVMRNAVKAVCAVSVITGLINVLAGGLRLKGQLIMIMDMLLLIVIITPFIRGMNEFELPEPDTYITDNYDYSEEMYISALREQTISNITDILAAQTEAAGFFCESIQPQINISDDMCISIERVVIKADDFEGAAEVIRSSLGADTEVLDGNTQ